MALPRLTLVCLAASLLLLAACAGTHAAPAEGSPMSLNEHQSVTVAPGAVLTYDSVNDSRCPPDVQCVVAGKLVYNFTLKQGDAAESFTLTPAEPAFAPAALHGKRIALAQTPPARAKADAAVSAHPVSIRIVAP